MKNVVIVGAGPAGLTAAYELLKHPGQYAVTILEQTGRAGGIACTVEHNGNYMDLGGHRFYSRCSAVTDWWRQIPGVPMARRVRKSEIYYDGKWLDYPLRVNRKNLSALGPVELVRIAAAYLAARLHKRQENSLEDFYINRFGKRLYELFFRSYTEKVWGVPPGQISPDWGSQRVRGLNILMAVRDGVRTALGIRSGGEKPATLIDAFDYPDRGPGQLWTAVADEIIKMGGEIRYGCRVDRVCTRAGRIAAVGCRQGDAEETLRPDILVSSMPVQDLIAGMDDAPEPVRQTAAGLVYRDFITVGVLVSRLTVKTDDCWIYMQDARACMGRLQIFNNWSRALVKAPDETVWLGLEYFCSKGDGLWSRTDAEMAALAVEDLVRTGVVRSPGDVLDTHVERVEQAYPAYFGSYAHMDTLRTFLDGFPNLYCIGRNGQHRYNNMDHAMLTAMECVKCIVDGLAGKETVWQVNTEKEYQECAQSDYGQTGKS